MRLSGDRLKGSPLAWGWSARLGVALAAVAGLWSAVGWALGWW